MSIKPGPGKRTIRGVDATAASAGAHRNRDGKWRKVGSLWNTSMSLPVPGRFVQPVSGSKTHIRRACGTIYCSENTAKEKGLRKTASECLSRPAETSLRCERSPGRQILPIDSLSGAGKCRLFFSRQSVQCEKSTASVGPAGMRLPCRSRSPRYTRMAKLVNLLRREIIETAQTLVVKVGTNALSAEDDTLDIARIRALADQLHLIHRTGRKVVLVSSGAIGAGLGLLGLKKRPDDLPHLQAAAAIGQANLIRLYDDCLKQHGYHAAQVLLTANDFKQRARYLNVRNTLLTLFEYGAVPIVNENDTVSVDEIRFGDNDRLAALVANLIDAPLLIILSVIDGLYDGDPKEPGSKVIPLIERWDEELMGLATLAKSSRGTGGMQTKLDAARITTAVGGNVIVANGRTPGILEQILAGEEVGTLFLAQGAVVPAWKRWIGYNVPPRGRYVLDAGARRAIEQMGKSLLAIGIQAVEGSFEKGQIVSLVDTEGNEFARGLSNYNSLDASRIAGKRSDKIHEILGRVPYAEVIHRDNLVVTSLARNGS